MVHTCARIFSLNVLIASRCRLGSVPGSDATVDTLNMGKLSDSCRLQCRMKWLPCSQHDPIYVTHAMKASHGV